MANILILAAGGSAGSDQQAPTCLMEINDRPLLQIITENALQVSDTQIIFAIKEQDVKRFSLDKVCHILDPNSKVIQIKRDTMGAACTALLACEYIDNGDELLVVATNEQLKVDFSQVINQFRENKLDAGTVVFPAIHPRYSYVRLSASGYVEEVAEKRPISRFATASFYWFRQGCDFVSAAQSMLLKQAQVGGYFFISPTFNELILQGKKIGVYEIEANLYKPLKKDST